MNFAAIMKEEVNRKRKKLQSDLKVDDTKKKYFKAWVGMLISNVRLYFVPKNRFKFIIRVRFSFELIARIVVQKIPIPIFKRSELERVEREKYEERMGMKKVAPSHDRIAEWEAKTQAMLDRMGPDQAKMMPREGTRVYFFILCYRL